MAKIAWSPAGQPVQAVMARARQLHRRHGPALASHALIQELLGRYGQAIAQTGQLSADLGLPALCMACAARDGVCCFAEVARRYDEYLLLINMLLGNLGPWPPGAADTCYFCGPQGCGLTAKHSFCHNFYCQAIKQALGPEALAALQRQVGQELSCQWELERVLLPWLWRAEQEAGQD